MGYNLLSELIYSTFHKTLPRSSLQMQWISVRFYEMGDTIITKYMIVFQNTEKIRKDLYMAFAIKQGR